AYFDVLLHFHGKVNNRRRSMRQSTLAEQARERPDVIGVTMRQEQSPGSDERARCDTHVKNRVQFGNEEAGVDASHGNTTQSVRRNRNFCQHGPPLGAVALTVKTLVSSSMRPAVKSARSLTC